MTLLELDTMELVQEEAAQAPPVPAAVHPAPSAEDTHILRFHHTERLLHWAIAVPFLVCFATALILVFVYNPAPHRPFRAALSWIHRGSGICLSVLPLLAIYRSKHNLWVHFYNIKQAWTWVIDDIKWLFLLLLSGVSKRVKLPEQGKFNAAEKINFMVLMATYPLYILTGLLIWLTHVAFLSWVLHVLMAIMAAPLILGHMYMALIARSGRPGLSGMFTGLVPRDWAKHHYAHWYREFHGRNASQQQQDGAQ